MTEDERKLILSAHRAVDNLEDALDTLGAEHGQALALMQPFVDAAREQVARCDCGTGLVFTDVWRKVPCPKCSRFRQPLADLDAADG